MALVTAAPYLALLEETDVSLKSYALSSLNNVVDQLWAEIANNLTDLEDIFEDNSFERRNLAALVISKVYYHLGDFDASVKYSLLAGDEFVVDEQSEYVETIVSKCLSLYISQRQKQFHQSLTVIDPALQSIFEKMLKKSIDQGELKMVLGIALDSLRLDVIKQVFEKEIKTEEERLSLISYVLVCSNSTVKHESFRKEVLVVLLTFLFNMKASPDFFSVFKIVVQLNDANLAKEIFDRLLKEGENLIAYQGAFDLVSSASQELLESIRSKLKGDKDDDELDAQLQKLLYILSGVPTCDYDITFLANNNNTDPSILKKTINALEGRSSIFHSAVSFSNAFLHAGTTDDTFFRKNLEWLSRATNWSKFTATAALGVIHKGDLSQGRNILKPYLPSSSGVPHTKGGSLYALGLVFAGHGGETIDYLKKFLDENGSQAGSNDTDIMLHGAALGCGVAGMGSNSESLYESLKVVLYSDSAISGQAAGLAMGLIMLGSGNETAITDMITYAQETQHENIIRGLAIGLALVNYSRADAALSSIDKLMASESSILRYGGAFTISLAYAGTGDKVAIKKLLHYAVSDPSDDVRRASVMGLGFVLVRDHHAVPQIVELLSQSHNPHVRYGTAMALGISCAGRNLPAAIKVLEPLTKDSVDFVRQGALMASAMILVQQNEHTQPKIKNFRKLYADTIKNKHEDALAKFGAILAQGIIDAGGRNVTIALENPQTNTLNAKAIVGLAVFAQSWYWFPLAHFLSLSFAPTAIIGVREDLKIPKFDINCHTKPEFFEYPPKSEESKEKQPDKITTAVLSTTNRAKARAKKKKSGDVGEAGEGEDEETEMKEESKKEEEKKEAPSQAQPQTLLDENKEDSSIRYTKVPYKIGNMTRVLPVQSNYISFIKDHRFVPVRKFKGSSGIIVLEDTNPTDTEFIKTIRQLNVTEAPVPKPFTLKNEDLEN